MLLKFIRAATCFALFALAFGSLGSVANGQDDPSGGGQVDPGGQVDTGGQTDTGQTTGGGTSTGTDAGFGRADTAVEIEAPEDTRNQGFVGVTATRMQELGFVGAASESSGPPIAQGRTFGGGVNGSATSSFSAAGNTGGARGGAGGFTTGNGINVIRRSVRARLRPSFITTRPSAEVVSSRFSSRIGRQPGLENLGGLFMVKVENRTAYLKGTVGSQAESQQLERQLRLEPGIYKIVNELQVSN